MSVIVWFRCDLRVFDHEPLVKALAHAAHKHLIPVYCIDPSYVGKHARTRCGNFPRSGVAKTRFLLESLHDLRSSLRSLGSDLVVRVGHPQEEIAEIAKATNAQAVYAHKEVCSEELAIERSLAKRLGKTPLHLLWGSATLHHLEDLPYKAKCANLPHVFTTFRKHVEAQNDRIRKPIPAPTALPPLPESVAPGEIPALEELCEDTDAVALASSTPARFPGGETAGRERLQHYIWGTDKIVVYKDTRNGLVAEDDSTKFSPWLAHGCITARWVYAEVARYERERTANESTYWVIFELLWRDYFRFVAIQHGTAIFREGGIRGLPTAWRAPAFELKAWTDGITGFPFVDANMRELAATGFMSNRGRQNVASFLTKDLLVDWRLGAEWFESLLIDHDPCSNYGNWNYVAGIGNDPRQDRHFNVIKQAKTYDEEGEYVHKWVPELVGVSKHEVHTPWILGKDRLDRLSYPMPIVSSLDNGRLPVARLEQYQQGKKFSGPSWMKEKAQRGVKGFGSEALEGGEEASSGGGDSSSQSQSKPQKHMKPEGDKRRKNRLQNKY